MTAAKITLTPLTQDDREQFILDNQYAFKYGAVEEFGMRDNSFEEDGEIISRETIERSIDGENAEAYRIVLPGNSSGNGVCEDNQGQEVGGVVIRLEPERKFGDLELLFVSPKVHSKGIGYAAWKAIEDLHPEVEVWETVTPYFETRNIHFYVNRCGFHIVEFFNSHHPDPNDPDMSGNMGAESGGYGMRDGMFRFQKVMNQ